MGHVTIEYMIMAPILILQIFLFPVTANWLMNVWVDSRRSLAIQDVASHLGSTTQQLYFSLNHESLSEGKATYLPGLPPLIEGITYVGSGVLRTVLDPGMNSSKVLELTVTLQGTKTTATTTVILGSNAVWRESIFASNSTHACVAAQKFPNRTIELWFGE